MKMLILVPKELARNSFFKTYNFNLKLFTKKGPHFSLGREWINTAGKRGANDLV